MKTKLKALDTVRYRTGKRRMRGTVVDFLPMPGLDAVPVLLRKKVVWKPRDEIRKLPAR